jgi:hypothetical protein
MSGTPTILEGANGLIVIFWSRREDLNAPSADYSSAALPLSYTGS